MSLNDLLSAATKASPNKISYKTAKVRNILRRQNISTPDYSEYDIPLKFLDDFKVCLFPELVAKIKEVQLLYSEVKVTGDSAIEENFYSNNIEGAEIDTLDETRRIINAKVVKGKKTGMVIGFSNAVQYITNNKDKELSPAFCNELNAIITAQYSDASRKGIRDDSVYVGSVSRIVFTPCECKYIPELFPKIFDSTLSGYDIITKSILMHFLMVWLHPYFDGNGRTARIISKEYLVRNGFDKFDKIPISKYIHESSAGYYRSIRESEEDMDITHFIIYMLDVYERALEDYL